jgi:hypothetical protein
MSSTIRALSIGLICCIIFALIAGATFLCINLAGKFNSERPTLALLVSLMPLLSALIACLFVAFFKKK